MRAAEPLTALATDSASSTIFWTLAGSPNAFIAAVVATPPTAPITRQAMNAAEANRRQARQAEPSRATTRPTGTGRYVSVCCGRFATDGVHVGGGAQPSGVFIAVVRNFSTVAFCPQ